MSKPVCQRCSFQFAAVSGRPPQGCWAGAAAMGAGRLQRGQGARRKRSPTAAAAGIAGAQGILCMKGVAQNCHGMSKKAKGG